MHSVDCTRRPTERKTDLPFAALPHAIAADPRLTPTDVRVLLALLFWARSQPSCWPADASIGARVGRSVGTVQRALRRLELLGVIRRERTPDNRTGRRIVLRWRETPPPPARSAPAAPARDEGRIEGKKTAPAGVAVAPPAETESEEALVAAWQSVARLAANHGPRPRPADPRRRCWPRRPPAPGLPVALLEGWCGLRAGAAPRPS